METTATSQELATQHGMVRKSPVFMGKARVTFFQRALAKAIDVVLAIALYYLGGWVHGALGIFSATLYLAFCDVLGTGQSIGKQVVGIRVAEESLGLDASFQESIVRNLPFWSAALFASWKPTWWLLFLVTLPWLSFEALLTFFLPTGVRLGDVMANTLVDEVPVTQSDL